MADFIKILNPNKIKKTAKLFTYDELNNWSIEKFREQGFPSEEQLKKEYEQYMYSAQHNYLHQNPYKRHPKSYEDFKQMRVEEFIDSMADTPKKKYQYIGDEWEETDEEPIKDIDDL